ncbi:MAG: glutamate--tRNA ligase [Chloroflexi bacterium]|nr:glutamate--tRNA ligase [Chloroflexota bacterium]
MAGPVRVRYAPSPTGLPHVGNIRSALFNWLFARHEGGTFILRIEDTDQERRVEGAYEAILESLRWLGLDWDEGPEIGGPDGPYIQSQRAELYQQAAQQLLAGGHAYLCYCSPERLEALREAQARRNLPTGYDRTCRNLSDGERAQREAEGMAPVVRFKMPLTGRTTFQDLLRGDVTWDNRLLDDFVLLKSDGLPTYHLANVVDDHAMRITHVLRGDEWLASTPRHLLLYQAFGWEPPVFAHLPLILGPDRAKLSKRHGAVTLLEYRDLGYLPQTLVNFLALLGWSLDDKTTTMTREEMVRGFSLERVSTSPAVFDIEKLKWMNGVYIRQMPVDAFAEAAFPFLERGLPQAVRRPLDWGYVVRVCSLVQDRARTLAEVPVLADLFFSDDIGFPPMLLWAGMGDKELLRQAHAGSGLGSLSLPGDAPAVRSRLEAVRRCLEAVPAWEHEALEAACRALAEELGVKTRELFGALRVAVTGRTEAPPLFATMEVLGRERALQRIVAAGKILGDTEAP